MTQRQLEVAPSVMKGIRCAELAAEHSGSVWEFCFFPAVHSRAGPIQILAILDETSMECLALLAEREIGLQEVADRLFELFVLRDAPESIHSGSAPPLLAKAMPGWLSETGVKVLLVESERSQPSDVAERFKRRLQGDLIDGRVLDDLPKVKATLDNWREAYNQTVLLEPPRSPASDCLIHPQPCSSKDWVDPSGPVADQFISGESTLGVIEADQSISSQSPLGVIEADQSVSGVSLLGVTRTDQSISSQSPLGVIEADQSVSGVSLLGVTRTDQSISGESTLGVIEADQSIRSEDRLGVIDVDQSIHPSGSVAKPDGPQDEERTIRVVKPTRVTDAPSLKPRFFPRLVRRNAIRGVKKAAGGAAGWVARAALVLLVLLVSLILVAPYFDWRVDTVRPGSMEPGLTIGSLVVTRPVRAEDISVGDVITFRSPASGEVISHRVSAIEDGPSFRTQDASGDADAFATPAQGVLGRVWFHVPFAGYIVYYLMTPTCVLLVFVFGLSIIVAGTSRVLELRRKPRPRDQG